MIEKKDRTQLLVGDLAEQVDWPAFYEAQLRRDYPVLSQAHTITIPKSALAAHIVKALDDGHTLGLAHWAHAEHVAGLASIGPLDALYLNPKDGIASRVRKGVAAHAVMLSLSGMAVVYLSDVLGLASAATPALSEIEQALVNPQSLNKRIYDGITKLVRARAAQPAFAPHAAQEVLSLTDGVWSIVRTAEQPEHSPLNLQQGRVVCLTNLSAEEQLVSADWRALLGTRHAVRDLFTSTRFNVHGPSLALQPYQVMWVTV